MQAMILAAGFGTRLIPYTEVRPKPLFPLLNIPLLLLIIERLQHLGFDHILINCHHLSSQIREAVQGISGVELLEESLILGTGGGLRNGLVKMRNEPLLITNGDIYHSIDFAQMYRHHCDVGGSVTLAVHDFPRFNSLLVDGDILVGFTGKGVGGALAFTGLHVIDPQILTPLAEGKKSCIIERYTELVRNGTAVHIKRVDGSYWTDMGTPSDYLALHGDLLQGRAPRWEEMEQKGDDAFLIAEEARIGSNMRIHDWACIGRARIGTNVHIERSVIWDGATVPDHSRIIDTIFSA